jgi:hypothetical protein
MPVLGDPLALRIDEPKIEVGRPLTKLLEEVRRAIVEEVGRIGHFDGDRCRETKRPEHLDFADLHSCAR